MYDLDDDDAVDATVGTPPALPPPPPPPLPSLCSFERRVCLVVLDDEDEGEGEEGESESASSPGVLLRVGASVKCACCGLVS